MGMSNYTHFLDGIIIRDMPIQQLHPGKIYFVNNSSTLPPGGIGGSDGNSGNYLKPFATIQAGINACTASRGDIVLVMPGHAETIATAGAITAKAGVAVIGLGVGSLRPTLTFSATGSTFALSAANFTLSNILTLVSVDAVVVCFPVTAANVTIDKVDYQLTSAKSPVSFITTTAAGTDLAITNCRHYQIAAVSVTKWIDLVGADRFSIKNNYMHVSASTHVLGGTTTASLQGYLENNSFHNGGSTAAAVIMLANTTGVARANHAAGAKTAVAGNMGLASMQGYENYSTHTANKNGLLDPVVDS
jgi:hypothetical protein